MTARTYPPALGYVEACALRYKFVWPLSRRVLGSAQALGPQLNEFTIAVVLKGLRRVTQGALQPSAVWFSHAASGDAESLQKHFGVSIEFGARTCGLAFAHAVADAPLKTRDDVVHAFLTKQADLKMKSVGARSFAATVVDCVESQVGFPKADLVSVCEVLGITIRTAQRRLREEGTSFREVIEEARARRAREMLSAVMPTESIAEALGFADAQSFRRAAKRWAAVQARSVLENHPRFVLPSRPFAPPMQRMFQMATRRAAPATSSSTTLAAKPSRTPSVEASSALGIAEATLALVQKPAVRAHLLRVPEEELSAAQLDAYPSLVAEAKRLSTAYTLAASGDSDAKVSIVVVDQGTAVRTRMLACLEYNLGAQLVNELAAIRRGQGHADTAEDLDACATLYVEHASVLRSDGKYRAADADEASRLASEIRVARAGTQRAPTKKAASAWAEAFYALRAVHVDIIDAGRYLDRKNAKLAARWVSLNTVLYPSKPAKPAKKPA